MQLRVWSGVTAMDRSVCSWLLSVSLGWICASAGATVVGHSWGLLWGTHDMKACIWWLVKICFKGVVGAVSGCCTAGVQHVCIG
jgi:hypothetical protein